MAIVQLQSTNPDFSFIIKKNPSNGMMIKSIRKGKAFGWFTNDSIYNIFFKDAYNEISYSQKKDEQFEYLNRTRYNSPLFPLGAIADFFSNASKQEIESDTQGFSNTFIANTVHVQHKRYLEYFQNHLNGFELFFEEVAYKTYRLTVTTEKSLHELLNYANILFLNLTFISEDYMDISKETIEKYMKSIQAIDAPFYIRYLFARNLLTSKQKFNMYKEQLEVCSHYPISFAFGPTNVQRREYITKQFQFNKPIVDIGCGEGFYALPLSKKMKEYEYHAIDLNPQVLEKLSWRIENKQIENVLLYESLDHFLEMYGNTQAIDVLLTEVVEHMPLKPATKFVKTILKNIHINTFVITTPNVEFNQFYALTSMRHDDHKWEMTKAEFNEWIQDIVNGTDYIYHWEGVGDCVDGIYTTQAAIITRKDENQ